MKTGPFANHGGMAIETQGVPGTEKYPQFGRSSYVQKNLSIL